MGINSEAFETNEKMDRVDFLGGDGEVSEEVCGVEGGAVEEGDDGKVVEGGEEIGDVKVVEEIGDVEGGEEIVKANVDIDNSSVIDEHCVECRTEYKDPPPSTLVMYLHAFKYSGDGWCFETEMPPWAKINNK